MKKQKIELFPGAVLDPATKRLCAMIADLARWRGCHSSAIVRAIERGAIRSRGFRYWDAEDAFRARPGEGTPGRKTGGKA